MAIYLKKFSNNADYETYINGSGVILPNVSICTTEGDVHYNPFVPKETRLVVKLNVTDTTNPTKISNKISGFSAIEIDGIEQPSVVSAYTFDTLGEHTVKYTLINPTRINEDFNGVPMTECTIPDSVTSIGRFAFEYLYSLTSVTIPNSVTSIGQQAFHNCSYLTSMNIPSGLTSIGTSAFQGCSSWVGNVNIPDGVTSIGATAFQNCSGLTSMTIGSGVTSISDRAFYNCSGLTSITLEATVPPTLGSGVFINTNDSPIYVPSSCVDAYKSASGWSTYSSRIQAIP